MSHTANPIFTPPVAAPHPSGGEEAVLNQGFRRLKFPAALEAAYLLDKAAERLRLIQIGAVLVILLSSGLLVSDWLMVPDQFDLALCLRLVWFTPLITLGLWGVEHVGVQVREWLVVAAGLFAAGIMAVLCVRSTDPLAPPYLITLALVLLFNGGVIRMRFWLALGTDAVIWVIFAVAACMLKGPSMVVLMGVAAVILSTTVFTLYNSYWLEHEDRTNWLMWRHEQQLMDELHQANGQLDHLSRFDVLTDLANRRHFDEFLEQIWHRARQGGQEVALLMIDIDHFKLYNDHYGHLEGDACLREVADVLKRQLRRPDDLVARFGGEEFVAVLAHSSLPLAMAAAERVRRGIADLWRPHAASPTSGQVTVSIGVASVRPSRMEDRGPAELIACADAALYLAKDAGRDRVMAQP